MLWFLIFSLGPCTTLPTIVEEHNSYKTEYWSPWNTLVNSDTWDDHGNWFGKNGQAAYFVVDLGCKTSISTLILRNSPNGSTKDRWLVFSWNHENCEWLGLWNLSSASKDYSVSVSESANGPWQEIQSGTFDNPFNAGVPNNLEEDETFDIDPAVMAQYVKYHCTSWYGGHSCAFSYIGVA